MHSKEIADTDSLTAEVVTESGLRIQRHTTPTENTPLNTKLSQELGRPIHAGNSAWLFMGPGQEQAAAVTGQVINNMGQVAAREAPDTYGHLKDFGACLQQGDQDGEPFTAVVVATPGEYTAAQIAQAERDL